MGVYINGMRFPNTCMECKFALYDETEDEYFCIFDYRIICKLGRLNDCPLVNVKEPHGRLIDADRAIEKLHEDKRGAYTKHDVWLMFSPYSAPAVIGAEKSVD